MRKASCKWGAIGLSAIMIFSFAGCGSSKNTSTASVSSTSKPKVTETATPTPTEEVKDISVVSTSSSTEEKKERDGYNEGTTNYSFYGLSFSVPNYFSLDSSSTSDNGVWYSETGGSVVMFDATIYPVTETITDENVEQYKGIIPAQFVNGMNNTDAGTHYISSDITNKKDITVGGYPALSFEITGEMNNKNVPEIKTLYNKIVFIFIPGTTNINMLSLTQSDNSKYSYITDFDQIINNTTAIETEVSQESSSSSSTSADPNQVTPELKAFLDSYEAFVDEYISFMNQYNQNPTDTALLAKYMDYMTKLTEFGQKADEYSARESQMSTADYNYYIDSMARISKKLIQASADTAQNTQQ